MKRHAPATARNAGPLAEVLMRELPRQGTILEIASGTGEHAVFLAQRFPHLIWQPSDSDPEALASIDAHAREAGLANLHAALPIDASASGWPVRSADAVVCVNMVHISPWAASEGLFAGAGTVMEPGAPLILYGPYRETGLATAASNEVFDLSLKDRDPDWGLRDLSAMDRLAGANGFERTARHAMPANNLTLVYRQPAHENARR